MKNRMKNRIAAVLMAVLLCSCGKGSGEEFIPQSMDDLNGHTLACILGSIHDVVLTNTNPDINLMRMSATPDLMAAVQSGAAEFCIVDSVMLVGIDLKQRGMDIALSGLFRGNVATAFQKTTEGDRLRMQYNEFLKELTESGQLEDMKNRWFDAASQVMPDIPEPTEGQVIRLGTDPANPPYSFIKDGKPAGFEVELVKRFSAYVGRPVDIQYFEFSGLIAAMASEKVDMICADMFVTEERSRQVTFSDSYYSCGACVLYKTAVGKTHKSIKQVFHDNLIVEDRWKLITSGLLETIYISIFAVLLGTLLGALLCRMRMSRSKVSQGIARTYINLMRGLPMLVLLMILFYVVFTSGTVSPTWVAIIAFALNFAAYVSEMFRTGIEGVDKGQTEAGLALGFTRTGTFINFVLPQAAKKVIPVFKGEVISLIKSTSIVGYIAIQDLTKMSDIIRSRTFDAFFPLIIVSIIYLILAWLIGIGLDSLAKDKTTKKHR